MSASSTLSPKLSEPTTTVPVAWPAPPPASGFGELLLLLLLLLLHAARNVPVRSAAEAAAVIRLATLEFTVAPSVRGSARRSRARRGMRKVPARNPIDRIYGQSTGARSPMGIAWGAVAPPSQDR